MDEARLKSVPLFSSLTREERAQVAKWTDEVDLDEGRRIVDKGDFSYEFFVIEEGTADVLLDEERIATLRAGDFFGEMGLLDHATRNASVVVTAPTTAIVMTGGAFRRMASEMPSVGQTVHKAVAERGRALAARAEA